MKYKQQNIIQALILLLIFQVIVVFNANAKEHDSVIYGIVHDYSKPIQLEDEGGYYGYNTWSIAKIDIYNKTAIKLDVPLSGLFTYESGVVSNGNFYMAISPIGGESYVYEFDPTSDEMDGFKKGLKIDGGNVIVDGIY